MKTCKDCKQGYTKEGNAAYPDHIELCSLHECASDLLEAVKFLISTSNTSKAQDKEIQKLIKKAESL